jgi:AcrR family transcriptional regulator
MSAAARVIASEGPSATTATIAKEAGVSSGSLFTYFETKAELLNQLYVELKIEMGAVGLEGIPRDSDLRSQMLHMWCNWARWAVKCPEKRRALARLSVWDEITEESRKASGHAVMGIAALLERSRKNGPLRDAPIGLVAALMSAMADATMDFMINDPANAEKHCMTAFDGLWRMLN